ncbi:MAG: PAS domain S-box protein [Anaerolineales bacterium]|nr:PAS domain S-box protein [Anaerolineales bacterium]
MSKDSDQLEREETDRQYRSIFDAASDGLIISDLQKGIIVDANPAACAMHGYSREEFSGLQLAKLIHPDSQLLFNVNIKTFQVDGIFDTRPLHIRRDGSTFYAEWRGTAINYQSRLCLLGSIRDVNKRIQMEQNLHQIVETRAREQVTLLEISHTLAFTLELQPGLILDQLRNIIEYSHGGLFVLEGFTLIPLATRGIVEPEKPATIRIDLSNPENLAVLFNGHRPVRIANIWDDEPQAQFLRSLLIDEAAILLEGMRSWMWVPVEVRDRIIGGIGVAHKIQDYFTAHHAGLALSVAHQAAITMINAELYGQAQTLAVLEERQRLARNLHDAINQSLFSAGLIAEVLPRLWEKDQQEARRSLEDLRRLTRGAQAEMRALLAELRPSTLTDSNLGDLLHLLGNALSGRTNIPVTVTITGESSLPEDVKIVFYRVCQEALFNIAKHAKASKVEIILRQSETMLDLQIQDNGLGFDPLQKLSSGHYGMSIMRERTEDVGAALSVTSQLGQGSKVSIQWPISAKKESL